ncbi:hypothetical protein OCU04_010888 [Sclerotinia nivalis]|uniref:Uncharacterized protein n=1 Tax=Sclerotinia nivalis TaxID=352851 RepID=A0A9X0DF58_9HELO|nr:hypothetical protein OCU04_010888 [Sclerotinia nivalis]
MYTDIRKPKPKTPQDEGAFFGIGARSFFGTFLPFRCLVRSYYGSKISAKNQNPNPISLYELMVFNNAKGENLMAGKENRKNSYPENFSHFLESDGSTIQSVLLR